MTMIFTALFAWMCVLNGQKAKAKGLSPLKYQWITTACFGAVAIIGGIIQIVNWFNIVFWSLPTGIYENTITWDNWSAMYRAMRIGTGTTMIWLLFVIIAAVVSYLITNSATANTNDGQPQQPRQTPPPVQPQPQPRPTARPEQNSQWQAPTKENKSFEVDLRKENETNDHDDGERNQ